MANTAPNMLAGGTITPSSFVIASGAADNTCLLSGLNGQAIGISQEGTHDTPGLTGAGTAAAVAGQQLKVYGAGDICLLKAGTGGIPHGGLISSDANGLGIVATTAGTDIVCAIGLETVAAGGLARVQILTPHKL